MKNKPILPAPGTGKRGESGYLGYLLRQAGAAYRLHAERTLAAHGVTLPQFSVLTMLNAYPAPPTPNWRASACSPRKRSM